MQPEVRASRGGAHGVRIDEAWRCDAVVVVAIAAAGDRPLKRDVECKKKADRQPLFTEARCEALRCAGVIEERNGFPHGKKRHPSQEQEPTKERTGTLTEADGHSPAKVEPTRDGTDHDQDREGDGGNDGQGEFNVIERMAHG